MGGATHVYANNNAIAAKSAKGKSPMAFPDVCLSPPTPPPTGVPVPYPNTCFAKAIKKGSRSVYIRDKEIALEDKSFFKTSVGNEPATPALKKGVVSGKIKGKGYFQMWSPNVKVEGRSVDRHMDLVSHNHGSPPNALMQKYKARDMSMKECERDAKRINEKCKPDDDKKRERQKRRGIKGKDEPPQDPSKYNWVLEHCGPLMVAPDVSNWDEFKNKSNFLEDGNFDDMVGKLMQEVTDEFQQELADYTKEKATKYAVRR
ncbi:MAG TPA: PAAR-like domain-containing protein, partial [Rubrivivax sp.]|nr:PAAR-like domain-containing protein [Rubrivivax sp.]